MNDKRQEQLKKVIQEHPEINDRIKELRADSQSELQAQMIELLKEYGVELTAEDFKAPCEEFSDDELNAVAGGVFTPGCTCLSNGIHMLTGISEPFESGVSAFTRGG
ncbi:MAG: hypothetical protein ACI4KB_07705 [Oscillospiraceae bacterium]|nr:hypothetical protein [Oscillospiraceae bacterium]